MYSQMSKFEKLEQKNSQNLHFCAEKVTKIENYTISTVHFSMNLVPLCTVMSQAWMSHNAVHSGTKFPIRCPYKKVLGTFKIAKIWIFALSKPLKIKFLRPKMSKFEKLEPKNPQKLHFCAEKVTKI